MFVILTMLDVPNDGDKTPVLINLASVQVITPNDDKTTKLFFIGENSDMNIAQTFDLMAELCKRYNSATHSATLTRDLIPD